MSPSIALQRLSSSCKCVALAADANSIRTAPVVQTRVLAAILLDEAWSIAAAKSIVIMATGTIMNATSARRRVLRFRNAERTLMVEESFADPPGHAT
jgi:hypothetical protein